MPSHPEILPVCLHSLSGHGASSSLSCARLDPKLCSLPLWYRHPCGCCWKLRLWRREPPFSLRIRAKTRVLAGSMLSVELNAFMKELPAVYLHYLSFGLFFNCNCSYIACVARTIRFPKNFLTCSSKGAHLGLARFVCVLSKIPLKFILISTSLRDLKKCP